MIPLTWEEEDDMATPAERIVALEYQVAQVVKQLEEVKKQTKEFDEKLDTLIALLNKLEGAKMLALMVAAILTVFGLAGVAKVVEFFNS